jgi:GAF domain-containing protein
LGLSLRYNHRYVDRFVDRVFFRKRHEDDAALRRFAHEASFITDRSTLLERAAREVREHTDAADVTILVQEGAATYVSAKSDGVRATASENDPGIVALRAWHKPVDLGSLGDSVLRGELAFPMVSRGTLVGVLVCDAKRSGEAYAPDESEALLALAHGVGTALDVLSAQNDGAIKSLGGRLDLIVQKLDALPSKLSGQVLPPAAQ